MSQHDSHCKQQQQQQQQHSNTQHRPTAGKRLAAALRLKSQCELVNKIASIDIWATERLYEKWRCEAVADRQPDRRHSPRRRSVLRSHNAVPCQRRSGGECLKATLVQSMGAAGGGGGRGDWPHRRRAHSRLEAAQLDDDQYQHQRRHHQHSRQRKHHPRRRSLSNESAVPHSRHCQWAQQHAQSERTSDIDWPDSWPSIWGSWAPKCLQQQQQQQQHTSSNSRDRLTGGKDAATFGCVACRAERRHGCRARHSTVASQGSQKMTLEALVNLKSVESDSDKRGGTKDGSDKHGTACRLSSNSSRPRRSMPPCVSKQGLLPTPTQRSKRRQTVDQDTYTIDGENKTVGEQHLFNSDQRPSGKAEQRLKTVAWKNVDQPKLDCISNSQHDVSTSSRSSSTLRMDEEPDDDRLAHAVKKLDRTMANSTRPTVNNARRRRKASSRDFAVSSIACNNSVDGKSLQMLSSATSERDVDTESPTSATMCAALITMVKPARLHSAAVCSRPKVMMQSNTAVGPRMSSFDDDLDDIIQTQVEFGESKGVEPKTGSVSRYVQDQVLMAAKLVATRGFAGLLGGPAREEASDPNTTDTVGTVEDEEEGPGYNRDSLGELDDLEDEVDEEEEAAARGKTQSGSRASTKARRPTQSQRTDRKARDSSSDRSEARRRGGDGARGASRQSRRRAADSPSRSKKLLPMTQCPTTQHRIECYRTQSGRVRCYMTARHPVKCHVEDGRIVCKATVNPETSHLPYPCNAAWH